MAHPRNRPITWQVAQLQKYLSEQVVDGSPTTSPYLSDQKVAVFGTSRYGDTFQALKNWELTTDEANAYRTHEALYYYFLESAESYVEE